MEKEDKKTETITIKITPRIKKELEERAKKKDWTLSHLCAKILTCYIEQA